MNLMSLHLIATASLLSCTFVIAYESIEIFPLAQIVANGGSAMFVCTVTSKGDFDWRIQWRKNGKSLKSERYQMRDIPRGSALRIEPVSAKRDEATYECVAINGTGKVQRRLANLIVQSELSLPNGFPRFVRQPFHLTYDMGGRIILHCDAVGRPHPEIMWFKNYLPLLTEDHLVVRDPNSIYRSSRYLLLDRDSTFIINDAIKSDEGIYHCMAVNYHGSVWSDKAYVYTSSSR